MPSEIELARGMRFGRGVMLERPAFAAAMMNVLTLSSEIEYRWAVVLAEILEAEAAAGVAMFNAVDNQTARGRLLKAAAEKRLPVHYRKQLSDLIKSLDLKLRNLIAHGQWGTFDEDPDCLILGDGKWASAAVASVHAARHGVETALGGPPPRQVVHRYVVNDFVVEAARLAEFLERQIELTKSFSNYRRVLRDLATTEAIADLRRRSNSEGTASEGSGPR